MKNAMQIIGVVALLFWGCGSGSDNGELSEVNLDSLLQAKKANEAAKLPDEVVADIIKSIPSPLEMTALIKASGAEYSQNILNNTGNTENYTTNFNRSLNLGVYSADLGYINIYEKTSRSVSYLNVVKQLADELKVGQFFDFSTIKRLAENNRNIDSILYISTSGFEQMDKYLKEKNRGNLSMLILLGGWTESLYIAGQVARVSKNPAEKLVEKIGEQKIVLDDLILLTGMYRNEPGFPELIEDLNNLKKAYSDVTITYTYGEPEMKEVDGVLVVVDNSSSKVNITENQLDSVIAAISALRNKIIS